MTQKPLLEIYFDHLIRCKKDVENGNFNLIAVLGWIYIYGGRDM